jgi:hypothetical protein
MAIDWGRMARGIGTGYLSAKIANTEANDKLNANIIERAGLNFYETELPEWQKSEKIRKETYDKLAKFYSVEVAEYAAQNGFVTGNKNDFTNFQTQIKGRGIDKDRLKAMIDQESTYQTRYETRAKAIQDREKTIMGLTSGSSKIGNMTAELLLKDDQTMTDATDVKPVEYETITSTQTVPDTSIAPGPGAVKTIEKTEEFPIQFSTGTYSFSEVFPKSKALDLDINEIRQLTSEAEKSFQRNVLKDYGSVKRIPDGSKYLEGFDPKVHKDETKYAMDRYKKEYIDNIINQYGTTVTEGKQSSTYAIPPGTKVSDIVIQARNKIAELQTQHGDNAEPYIEQINSIVKEQLNLMNVNPSDFGF